MEDYFAEHILQYLSNDDELRALSLAIDQLADYVTINWFENASIPQHIWNKVFRTFGLISSES
jgi:hypothetical protein